MTNSQVPEIDLIATPVPLLCHQRHVLDVAVVMPAVKQVSSTELPEMALIAIPMQLVACVKMPFQCTKRRVDDFAVVPAGEQASTVEVPEITCEWCCCCYACRRTGEYYRRP